MVWQAWLLSWPFLLYERRRNILAQTVIPEEKMALPSSVRLAKFEKVLAEPLPSVQEAKV